MIVNRIGVRRVAQLSVISVLSLALLPWAMSGSAPASPAPDPARDPTTSSAAVVVNADSAPQAVYTADRNAGDIAWFAGVRSYDSGTAAAPGRNTWVSWSTHADFGAGTASAGVYSNDAPDGVRFDQQVAVPAHTTSARRADGSVYAIEMTDGKGGTQYIGGASTRRLWTAISTDDGRTFGDLSEVTVNAAPLEFGGNTSNVYPMDLLAAPDGTLYLAAYGNVRTVAGGPVATTAFLLQSKDNGASWTYDSVLAAGSAEAGKRSYTEPAIALNAHGDLIAVIRNCLNIRNEVTGAVTCGYVPFQVTTRANGAAADSWSQPADIQASGFPSTIRPTLRLLPNGVLALLGGRQDTWLTISEDGLGATWTQPTKIYANNATDADGNLIPYPGTINEGSSGNSGFDVVGTNRVLAAADTCHVVFTAGLTTDKCMWRRQVYHLSDTSEEQIKVRQADILTPGAGKLDLRGMITDKRATVSVSNSYTAAPRKRLGPNGAVDGSTEQWSAAATAGGPGSYTISLDKAYRLNRIGLSQWIGRSQSAKVEVATSPDGPWKTWWNTGQQTSYALVYKDLPVVTAQYVRVSTDGSSNCPDGMTAPCSMLNEMELYAADTHTFENDPLYTYPRDYTTSRAGVRTIDINTAGAGRVLELQKVTKGGAGAFVQLAAPVAAERSLSLRFKPHWYGFDDVVKGDKFIVTIQGSKGSGTANAYTVAIVDDGSLAAQERSGKWRQIAPAGTVPGTFANSDAWSTLTVTAGVKHAEIAVNGRRVASAQNAVGGIKGITGYGLSTDVDPRVDNQIFYLDDIDFH